MYTKTDIDLFNDYHRICDDILSSGNDLPDSMIHFWSWLVDSKSFSYKEADQIYNTCQKAGLI